MNLSLVAVARDERSRGEMLRRAAAAITYVEAAAERAVGERVVSHNAVLYNSNPQASVWSVPTVFRDNRRIVGVSQPPIVVDQPITEAQYSSELLGIVDDGAFERLLPNHFGTAIERDGAAVAWTDIFALARGYYVATERFVAISNHIGALSFFLDKPPAMDEVAWGLRSMFGWFAGHRSTLRDIRSLPSASRVDVSPNGDFRVTRYADLTTLIGGRSTRADYASAASELGVVSANVAAIGARTPRVFLSGGQDSRMSAGAWLAGGAYADVVTYGTLHEEAAIAEQLMACFWSERPAARATVTHEVVHPSATEVRSSMSERISKANALWDGDYAVNVITRDVSVRPARGKLSIGGMGGELMHGYFYMADGMLQKVRDMGSAAERLHQVFRGQTTPEEWTGHGKALIDSTMETVKELGYAGPTGLDVFYLLEKYRRWPNSRLYSSAVVPLASPAFVRAAFDMTPEQRLAREGQRAVAESSIAGWGDIPYFKGSAATAKPQVEKRGLRLWQKDPEYFEWIRSTRQLWPLFVKEARMEEFLARIDSEEGLSAHESWVHFCLLVETFPEHLATLARATAEARKLRDDEVKAFWRL